MADPPSILASRCELLLGASRHPLASAVAGNLRARCRVGSDVERVIVGVSGGPDSTALLAILAALAERRAGFPTPIVVSVHHGLRAAADEECALVARLARRLGLPYERVDVRPAGRAGNVSANARDDRYGVLKQAALRHRAALVATGHHADDRLETMVLGLARGKGLRGLTAPRWSRTLGDGVRLVRPLLDVEKSACIECCEALDLETADDPTNGDPSRARGHLRRSVLPALTARYPKLAMHASRAADEASLALWALERLVARRFGPKRVRSWDRSLFRSAGPSLGAWALRRSAHAACPDTAVRVARSGWERAAKAACDGRREPRTFAWGRLRCTVRANEVALDTVTSKP